LKIKRKGKGVFDGMMEESIQVNGRMANNMIIDKDGRETKGNYINDKYFKLINIKILLYIFPYKDIIILV
jgi:hypothetical protein